MPPQLIFLTHLVLGYVACLLCFGAYILPRLRSMEQMEVHRVIATVHSFRFFGLVFILPGVVSPDLPASFAAFAAYGDFADFYESWKLNATRLYPLLEQVKSARVMMFYFHGDDFDPGGRGERSPPIQAERGHGNAVVDQPAILNGQRATTSGLFQKS